MCSSLGDHRAHRAFWCGVLLACCLPLQRAAAQTDFLNTDGGRPLQVQDAISVEWRAVELQFAPLAIDRHRNNQWQLSIEPELALGLWPRTHLSIGLPVASLPQTAQPRVFSTATQRGYATPSGLATNVTHANGAASRTPGRDVIVDPSLPSAGQVGGLAGVHLSVFHQLNVETRLPALAVRAEVLLPAGPFGPSRAIPSVMGLLTRTLPALGPVRLHANAAMSFGAAPEPNPAKVVAEDVPRWMAGVSLDRAFALQSTLLAVEAVAERGRLNTDDVIWRTGVGARHQFSPRLVLDVGASRQLNGPDAHWSFTVGSAIALSLGRRLL